jgi:hypothetical protein
MIGVKTFLTNTHINRTSTFCFAFNMKKTNKLNTNTKTMTREI